MKGREFMDLRRAKGDGNFSQKIWKRYFGFLLYEVSIKWFSFQ